MNDLLSLLLFAVLFVFMMRFGCAHGSHGRKHTPGDDQHSRQH
jgi:hypothetical protein